MNRLIIDIHLSNEEFLKLYQGVAKNVFARARDGRSVRFPANILQPFLLHNGIHGSFELTFTAEGKLANIRRL